MAEGEELSPKLPRYGAVRHLANEFKERIKRPDRAQQPEKYTEWDGGILFLRYYSLYRKEFESEKSVSGRGRVSRDKEGNLLISPQEVAIQQRWWKDAPDIKIPWRRYKEIMQIRRDVAHIDDTYNTEDGQIKWLLEHNLPHVPLRDFYNIVPTKVRARMTKWKSMSDIPAGKGAKIYLTLATADQKELKSKYNTFDGQVRWLRDNGLEGVNLVYLRQNTPKHIRALMTRWVTPWGTEPYARAERFHPVMEATAKTLRDTFLLDDPSAERRIASMLARTTQSDHRVLEILHAAHEYADRLMTELSIAKLITPEQNAFDIQSMHDIYAFARERFSISPEATWVILRLKKINLVGVKGLIRRGYRNESTSVPLSTPLMQGESDGPTVEDVIGAEDQGFAQVEAREVLKVIVESGHLNEVQVRVLEKVIGGNDLEDEEYAALAESIRTHPELMELLGIEKEE